MQKNYKISLFLLVLAIINSHTMKSQVGINTEIPKASLDITKNDELSSDGILIPRMTVQELITRHTAGLYSLDQNSILVYINDITNAPTNPQTKEITKIGFYFYNSNEDKWIPIASSNNIWNKVGTTTSSENNTDNSYLIAKAVIGGDSITSINGGVHNAQLTVLGEDIAIRGITVGTGAGGNSTNSVLGKEALLKNTTGTYNVAIGNGALSSATTGLANVAIGVLSSGTITANGISSFGGLSSAGSDFSTAIGNNAIIGKGSDKATALGYYSTIETNSDGSIAIGEGSKIGENAPTSISIGKQAYSSELDAIAIGKSAGANATNAIAIGNGAVNNIKDATFIKNRTTIIGNSIERSNVTLQIVAEKDSANKADGLLVPILTLAELNAKDDQYNEAQFGTIIFVNFTGDPGVAEGKTEDVNYYGFYYYDYWNPKGSRWTKLSDAPIRKSPIQVGSDKAYKTLQDAYNNEAKKNYNQNGAPMEFICSGEVGGLDTDGSIPYIKITSDGTMTTSDKGLTFSSTTAHIEGKIDLKTNDITAYNSDLVVLKNSEIIAKGLSIDNSSFKAFFGGNNFTLGYINCFNGFIDIEGSDTDTNLNLVGDPNIGYLVSAANGGYILFANNVNITSNSTTSQYCTFTANNTSTIHFSSVKEINFKGTYDTNQTSYDIYANILSNIILEECHNIGGTSTPNIVIAASLNSNIVSYQSIINKKTLGNGISVISSNLSIIGDRSSITLKGPGTSSSIGIVSSGGNVTLSSISPASKAMVTLEDFSIGISATDGGSINAMKRIQRSTNIITPNIPTTLAIHSATGSVIYDSDTE